MRSHASRRPAFHFTRPRSPDRAASAPTRKHTAPMPVKTSDAVTYPDPPSSGTQDRKADTMNATQPARLIAVIRQERLSGIHRHHAWQVSEKASWPEIRNSADPTKSGAQTSRSCRARIKPAAHRLEGIEVEQQRAEKLGETGKPADIAGTPAEQVTLFRADPAIGRRWSDTRRLMELEARGGREKDRACEEHDTVERVRYGNQRPQARPCEERRSDREERGDPPVDTVRVGKARERATGDGLDAVGARGSQAFAMGARQPDRGFAPRMMPYASGDEGAGTGAGGRPGLAQW